MAAVSLPVLATVAIALLADRSTDQAGDRIYAVAAWTDQGERRCAWLATPTSTGPHLRDTFDLGRSTSVQLTLDLGGASQPWPTSSGRTWATWTLTSIPAAVRTLPLDAAVTALARQLDEAA